MFELSIALKYLIPRKRQLSVSLIALMSISVISLVVWLVLIFLSITEGIERSWLEKLTHLNAPVRITPTAAYYSSYYYQIDSLSQAANFHYKTISEKAETPSSDPYNPEEDRELSSHFPAPDHLPDGSLRDPVKMAYQILSDLKHKRHDLNFQEFELSGALMRLQLLRSGACDPSQNFLTQVTYVASFADKVPYVHSLLLPPEAKDLNHLFYLATHNMEGSREDAPSLLSPATRREVQSRLEELFFYIQIEALKPSFGVWKIPFTAIPENTVFQATLFFRNGQVSHITIPAQTDSLDLLTEKYAQKNPTQQQGFLEKKGDLLIFRAASGKTYSFPLRFPLTVEGDLSLQAQLIPQSLPGSGSLKDLRFKISTSIQGAPIRAEVAWDGLEIQKASFTPPATLTPTLSLPWFYRKNANNQKTVFLTTTTEQETGVLLAKNFQENGVMIGDRGYLSFAATSAGSMQEQRLKIYVAGFYDPGIMPVGSKCVLAPPHIARLINNTGSSFNLDKTMNNGIAVWFADLNATKHVQKELQSAFNQAGIDPYWKISTFYDYDFAKDLIQQFQSDKTLFSLVGCIILIVACCNIISLLVLLVNDKKQEIGILQAMGASPKSIATIFGLCGITVGILSSLIGTTAALFTMHNIDAVAHFLSAVQGHEVFNAAFYGKSLPRELSHNAVLFILVTTPIISLCAGLVPAIKACRLRPSVILRQE